MKSNSSKTIKQIVGIIFVLLGGIGPNVANINNSLIKYLGLFVAISGIALLLTANRDKNNFKA